MQGVVNFKEKASLDLRTITKTLDNQVKGISFQQESLERKIKDYCVTIVENSEIHIRSDIKYCQNTFNDIRLENGRYHFEAIKLTKEVKEKLDGFLELKAKFNAETEKIQKQFEECIATKDLILNEYNSFKSNYESTQKTIKVTNNVITYINK